ncbi:alpha/beta hydrolase [Halorubraceae archaeon YAN]|nr:alpha/beta hydrolase [Halorubraceae archaeon YAN]
MSRPSQPQSIPTDVPGESVFVETNGIELHTVQAGPEDGPLVILLHGFPEFWYGWHNQIRALANDGYRVIVPDQRGYNLSDKPPGIASYHIDELTQDVIGLIDAYDREMASIAGHDWGAAVAWWAALHYPDRLSNLCIVNVPHPTVMQRTLQNSWEQRMKSWYFLGFQLPKIPETLSRLNNWRGPTRALKKSSQPGTFTQTDLEYYRNAWSQPGAFEAMINWYRAIVRYRPSVNDPIVAVPTLVIWGAEDTFLKKSMAWESVDLCEDGQLVMLDTATHWVLHEEPVRVSNELCTFLNGGPLTGGE